MSSKTVRVICALPSQHGIVFRSPYGVTSAFDGEGHGDAPLDLELKAGVNESVSAAAVRYWAARSTLSFAQVGDTVFLTYDADAVPGESVHDEIARKRRALDAERLAFERKKINDERAALDAERKAYRRPRKRR